MSATPTPQQINLNHFTPDLNNGTRIFVFGSNLAGRHGAGAANTARKHWGAITGIGTGMEGQSYAIPTKDQWLNTLPLSRINWEVKQFISFAVTHPDLTFLVTKIGCGLAGYTEADIKPMFADTPPNCILPKGWRN